MARASAKKAPPRARATKVGPPGGTGGLVGSVGRARLAFLGALVVSAIVLFAWFPASSLLSQRSNLTGAEAQLGALHTQDAALAQERKNLSDAGEIGRIAREQYQLVSPGQQAYQVLPPSGATAAGTPYAGDPGADGPVTPSAYAGAPSRGRDHDDDDASRPTAVLPQHGVGRCRVDVGRLAVAHGPGPRILALTPPRRDGRG